VSRVSVVIPTYQSGRYVGSAIESVLVQTRPPDEVIVVDDGSTDDTADVLGRFGQRIRVIRQANAGVSLARDRGARSATGSLVAFLDADDEWSPRKLEVQVPRMSAPEVIASFTEALFEDERSGRTWHVRYTLEPDMTATLLLRGCVIGNNSTVVVRREPFLAIGGYDPALSQSADWDMWIRLSEHGRFELVREPLARYRVRAGSMSADVALLAADNVRVLDKFFASPSGDRYRTLRRRAYGRNWVTVAGSYLHRGDPVAAVLSLARASAHHPAALGRALTAPLRWYARLLGRAAPRR
jgi:glycosyltransferase involved in cell wall biosynthesis